MPTPTTVSTTSPLFYLHRLGQLELLPRLYGSILVPEEVARELERGRDEGHDAPNVAELNWASVRLDHIERSGGGSFRPIHPETRRQLRSSSPHVGWNG